MSGCSCSSNSSRALAIKGRRIFVVLFISGDMQYVLYERMLKGEEVVILCVCNRTYYYIIDKLKKLFNFLSSLLLDPK